MTAVPLAYLPGVTKSVSPYASSKETGFDNGSQARGRFIDMDGVRFRGGYPEKLKGSSLLYSSSLTGVPRAMKDWRDFNQVVYVGIGTNAKLYYYADSIMHDITPLRGINTGTLTNPLTTIMGSAVVNVQHTAHGQVQGEFVQLTAGATVGGLVVAGVYPITTVVDANNYTITLPSAATSSASSGGGSVAYVYFRKTLTNPFSTVSGSTTVTVNDNANGANTGDFVTYSGATAVGGLTISGEYAITSSGLNSYTITAATPATSTASNGGGTPSVIYDISTGFADSLLAFGYGTGGYGENGYGTTGSTGVQLNARTWSLQNYGQQLLASPIGGTIYVWDPRYGGRAYPLYNAPPSCNAMFVTPERFVVALGVYGNPMQLAWADQNDYTQWTSTPTNSANSGRTLQEGSALIGGVSTRNGINMIFSDTASYNMVYTGDNNVYETLVSAKKCGLVGPLAATELGDSIFWMTDNDFWFWNGNSQGMPSNDIRAYVYGNINLAQSAKFIAGTINGLNEVIFFYCSASANENDRWVRWHDDQQCWSAGTVMPRSSWLDKNLLAYPLATTSGGLVLQQEYGTEDQGNALNSFVKYAPFDISEGDIQMDIFSFIPDFLYISGNMTVSVSSQDRPMSTPSVDGPYTIAPDGSTPIIDLRSNGRLVGYTLTSDVIGGDWRLGLPAVSVQQSGARR